MQGYISTMTKLLGAMAILIRDVLVLAFNSSAAAWKLLSQAFTIAWPYIKIVLDAFYSLVSISMASITGILTALSQLAKGDFAGAFKTMKETIGTALTDLWGFFSKLQTDLKTFFDAVKPEVLKLGTDMVKGIADGIKSGAGKIKDALLAAAREAWNEVVAFFGGQDSGTTGRSAPAMGGRSSLISGANPTNTNGATYNLNMNATYSNNQSESSLINDARAWMMTLGAE